MQQLFKPTSPRHVIYGLAYAFFILMLDQYSKWMILNVIMQPPRPVSVFPLVSFNLVWNHGITFGMLSNPNAADYVPWAMSGVAVLIVLGLLRWLWQIEQRLVAAAIGAIIGGAIGNIIDRCRFGAVLDFIQVSYYPWIFNVADSAVVVGVGLLIWQQWHSDKQNKA